MDDRDNIYNLPWQTEAILIKHNPEQNCLNLGLLLDKYVPKHVFEKPDSEKPWEGKTVWLLDILKPRNTTETQNNHIDPDFAKHAYDRWHTMTRVLGAEPFNASLDWRMVVGLGGETVLETDLTLHHLYGIPTIPGSALKGLTRAYAATEKFLVADASSKLVPSKKIDDDHPEIKRIFGSQEKAGTVLFFDAMPKDGKARFAVDIINPHYPKYYGQGAAPANDQNPIPVTFLTVTSTTFMFALALRNPNDTEHTGDIETVKVWLQEALQKYGVGGKTSAGYGYFRKAKDKDRKK